MFNYEVKYMISPGSWYINEVSFYCKSWSKYGAWKKWLRETKNHSHYTSYEYIYSYWRMRKDIFRLK